MAAGTRSYGLLVATAVALLVPTAGPVARVAPAVAAANLYPLLTVTADYHLLAGVDDLDFEASYLSAGGETQGLTITTPVGFGASVIDAVGTKLGTAAIGVRTTARDAPVTKYVGSLLVMDPAAYAADPGAQACDPGTHTAVWSLTTVNVAAGNLTIPIAVDAAAGGYKLTMCLGAVQALGRETEYVYFQANGVFRNPAKRGTYLFDGTVTPFASGSTAANPSSAYEFRAYEVLPQTLGIVPAYNPENKTLAVAGLLSVDGRPRPSVNIHVFGGMSSNATQWTDLGVAVTNKNGTFLLTKKLSRLRYLYVYAQADGTNGATCPGNSAEPGGCASDSFDWRSSAAVKVVSTSPITSRTAPSQLRDVLLSAVTVSSVPGAPAAGFVNVPIGKAGLTENTDPRTPCGAKLSDFPTLQTGAIAFFASTAKTTVLQWVNRLRPGLAASVMRSESAGARPGCADFKTTDVFGVQTTNRLVGVLALPPSGGDKRLAVITKLTEGKQSAYLTKVLLERGSFLMLTEVLTVAGPSRTFVTQLAIAAAKRFDDLPTT